MSRYSVNNSRPQWKSKSESHSVVSIQSMEFSRLEYWSLSLLHGIFPTQGSNPYLLHCRWILYQLSLQGNLRILEWVAYLFSSGSSQPSSPTGVSCIAGRFFTSWAMRCFVSRQSVNIIHHLPTTHTRHFVWPGQREDRGRARAMDVLKEWIAVLLQTQWLCCLWSIKFGLDKKFW